MKPGATARPHLAAALVAAGAAAAIITAGLHFCRRIEERSIHALAPEFIDAKLQGAVLQRRAFAERDLLVLYGSSELAKEMPNNPCHFFSSYPTGFNVFAVGKPGTTALAILQKVAAVGDRIKGRKMAVSISPGVFFSEVFDPQYYEGNFSDLQALELVFSNRLSRSLKRDAARRMLEFPKTLEGKWLLRFALRRLAGDAPLDGILYAAIAPLGWLQKAVGRGQDHFESARAIIGNRRQLERSAGRQPHALDWDDLFARSSQFVDTAAVQAKKNEVAQRRATGDSRGAAILHDVTSAQEWIDLELLLRGLHELGAQPLLLSMPVEDIRLEVYGAPPSVRKIYLERLNSLAARYQFQVLAFQEHESDPTFLVDFLDHLSGKGWLYYDKALDDFFHGRPPLKSQTEPMRSTGDGF